MLSDGLNSEVGSCERTRLLNEAASRTNATNPNDAAKPIHKTTIRPVLVLPVSFLASLALHMTAASSAWAFAYLFCQNPKACKDVEKSRYAGSVAIAITLANLAGLISLGYLEKLVKWDARVSLIAWLTCRSLGVLGIAVGVYLHNFSCLLGGQVLQGLASDNLLHFNLNSVYAQADSTKRVSTLMGTSLALYMMGMAIGPAGAGLLPSFEWSFFVAVGLFSVAIIYVLAVVSHSRHRNKDDIHDDNGHSCAPTSRSYISNNNRDESGRLMAMLSPARFFLDHPGAVLQGLSLFLYNMVQGYEINLIFIFASVQFGFTARENGILLSVVAVVAATYLLSSLFLVPRLLRIKAIVTKKKNTATLTADQEYMARQALDHPKKEGRVFDLGAAALAILIQATAALFLSQVHTADQLYLATAMTALGFAAPSFIKSYFVASLPDPTQGVSGLALMETSGGLLSPMILGLWQASRPDSSVFYVAAGILAGALVLLIVGARFHR